MKIGEIVTEWKKGASKDIDPTVAHDTDITMQSDRVEDHNFDSAYEPETDKEMDQDRVAMILKTQMQELRGRERHVIQMRFGLGEYEEHTLAEIAKIISVNPERVRQIEAKALRKLRNPRNSGPLKSALPVYEANNSQRKSKL